MLTIDNLHFSYKKNSPPVLKGINMELSNGEIGVILGKNGSGKTTLFKNILGLCKPQKGSISFDGQSLYEKSQKERAAIIAYVPQSISFGDLNVFDTVLMGRLSYFGFRAGKKDYELTEKTLAEMQLKDCAAKSASALSGGEQQKVAIARALNQQPHLMVFDEPTGNLDIGNEQLIAEEAKKTAKKGIGILLSMHNLNLAANIGDRFFLLKDGIIKYSVTKEQLTEEIINDVFDSHIKIIKIKEKSIIIGE